MEAGGTCEGITVPAIFARARPEGGNPYLSTVRAGAAGSSRTMAGSYTWRKNIESREASGDLDASSRAPVAPKEREWSPG